MSDTSSGPHSGTAAPGARIDAALERVRESGQPGLMTHIIYGYPDVESNEAQIQAMVEAGVDLIEVQLPFSDPTADGPTITQACQVALERGAHVQDALDFVRRMTDRHDVPILFMSYFNLVFSYHAPGESERGTASFVRAAREAGAAGLIVPDLPPEATVERYPELCAEAGLYPIYVTSPNVTPARLEVIARFARGFIYCTSRTGTTGKDVELDLGPLGTFLDGAREITKLPLAVGFSISTREQIEALGRHADVAVVGSHLLRVFDQGGAEALGREIRKLRGRS